MPPTKSFPKAKCILALVQALHNCIGISTTHEQIIIHPWKPFKSFQSDPSTAIHNLPAEIWTTILSYLEHKNVLHLAKSQRELYRFLLPAVYYTVDLARPMENSYCPENPSPEWDWPWQDPSKEPYPAPKHFCRSVSENSRLGKHTRRLSWTTGWEDDRRSPPTPDICPLFIRARFENVQSVDLRNAAYETAPAFPDDLIGTVLFPAAREIKLQGIVSKELFEAMFHNHTSTNIHSVHFENIFLTEDVAGDPTRVSVLTLSIRCRKISTLSLRVTAYSQTWEDWASFIYSVKPKKLVFNCSRSDDSTNLRKESNHGRNEQSRNPGWNYPPYRQDCDDKFEEFVCQY